MGARAGRRGNGSRVAAVILVKIGGGESVNLEGVAADLSELKERFVVVHGANALRDALGQRLGVEKRVLTSVSGYESVHTDAEAIDLMLMAYAGLRNKRIVELLQMRGVSAVGLTGLDGAVVRGSRNKGIRVREGGKTLVKRDLSGKPRAVNKRLLGLLLDGGFVPVLTVPIADEGGVAINSENDDIVAMLGRVLRADCVIQLIEAPGFLDDPADPGSVIASMSRGELAVREEQARGRMKRKMRALRLLAESTRARIVIGDGRAERPIRDVLEGRGTVIS